MARENVKRKQTGGLRQYLTTGGLDVPFFAILISIVVIGLVMLYSATYVYAYYYKEDSTYFLRRQLIWVLIGIVAMLIVSHINFQKFEMPIALLGTVPVAALVGMAFHWPAVAESLFHNDAIPRWLLVFGSAGQILFSLRFLYQAIYSARRGASLLPAGFWLLSIAGACIILVYGILRRDPVVILAQSFGLVTYVRNLILWNRSRRSL